MPHPDDPFWGEVDPHGIAIGPSSIRAENVHFHPDVLPAPISDEDDFWKAVRPAPAPPKPSTLADIVARREAAINRLLELTMNPEIPFVFNPRLLEFNFDTALQPFQKDLNPDDFIPLINKANAGTTSEKTRIKMVIYGLANSPLKEPLSQLLHMWKIKQAQVDQGKLDASQLKNEIGKYLKRIYIAAKFNESLIKNELEYALACVSADLLEPEHRLTAIQVLVAREIQQRQLPNPAALRDLLIPVEANIDDLRDQMTTQFMQDFDLKIIYDRGLQAIDSTVETLLQLLITPETNQLRLAGLTPAGALFFLEYFGIIKK
jgi:hypothetical protein